MDEIDKAATVIVRYLIAQVRVRHRLVKKGLHPADVIPSLHRGVRVFHHEITVYPKAPGIITSDPQDDDLFRAIILGEDGAIEMDAADLQQWRKYIVELEGAPPRRKVDH